MTTRSENETFKVKNPLDKIIDAFSSKIASGKVEGKDLRRYCNKVVKMLEVGDMSKDEAMGHLNAILRQQYSFDGEKGITLSQAYTDCSEIRKDLYDGKELALFIKDSATEITQAAEPIKINYTLVSEKIEKKEEVKPEHIAAALTTLKIDLLDKKIDKDEAQKHLNGYTSLEFPKDSPQAKIREQLLQCYGENFTKRGLVVTAKQQPILN